MSHEITTDRKYTAPDSEWLTLRVGGCYGGTVHAESVAAIEALIASEADLRAEVERLQAKEVGWFMGDKEAAAAEMARLRAEVGRLERWKAEALNVLDEWEKVHVALGSPGVLGQMRSQSSLAEVERLTAANQDPPRFTANVGHNFGTINKSHIVIQDGGAEIAVLSFTTDRAEALAAQINGAQPAPTRRPTSDGERERLERKTHGQAAEITRLLAWQKDARLALGRLLCGPPVAPVPPADTVSLTVSKRAWDELVAETWDMQVGEDAVTGCVFAVLESIAALAAKDGAL